MSIRLGLAAAGDNCPLRSRSSEGHPPPPLRHVFPVEWIENAHQQRCPRREKRRCLLEKGPWLRERVECRIVGHYRARPRVVANSRGKIDPRHLHGNDLPSADFDGAPFTESL